jgi:fibro-slime domain-containing protein
MTPRLFRTQGAGYLIIRPGILTNWEVGLFYYYGVIDSHEFVGDYWRKSVSFWRGYFMKRLFLGIAAITVALGLGDFPAKAANMVGIDWFAVTPGFADFNYPACGTYNCGQVYTNSNPEVNVGAGSLVGGMPTVAAGNPAGLSEGVNNPLQWWTPQTVGANSIVSQGTTATALPIGMNMFTPHGAGGNDGTLFQTAIIFATITVGTGGGTITYGGDDDMFLAINGQVVNQLGGIHPYDPSNLVSYTLVAGTYSMEVFYADRHVTDAYADLSVDNITTSVPSLTEGVPEPSTWAMLILGFAGIGYMAYRRKAKPALMAA